MRRLHLLFVGLALALAGCGGAAPAETPANDAPLVQVVAVAAPDAAGAVRASGLVSYKRETPLSFSSAGIVESLRVDVGDRVRTGQLLASLRRVSVGANAEEAAVARANADRNLERVRTLFERGFASQAALDDAELAAQRARAGSTITAPTGGVILRRNAEQAQMVDAGAPVLVLGDVSSGLIVRAPLSSDAARHVAVGDSANVRVGDVTRAASVTRVAAKGDDATGAFEIEVRLASTEGLRSGEVAEVTIAGDAPQNASAAFVIPTLSLLDARADQGVVFVVDAGNIARRRTVQTAGLANDGVLIVRGLAAGERIVAAGAAYVRDGAVVRVAEPS